MKRTILTLILAAAAVLTINAQPRGIGARFGYGSQELSYQHYVGNQFLQCDLGTSNFHSIQLHATYNWIWANPGWTTKGDWYFYGGAGVACGYSSYSGEDPYGFFGLAGDVGLEYQFWFPMSIAADIRPVIAPKFGAGGGLYNQWGYMFCPCISVRYLF